MINASDLIDVHLGEASEAQGRRVSDMIEAITSLSREEKEKLTQDLLTIALNTGERTLRRVQAARTLGHQARRLGTFGASTIAHRALKALEEQFIPRMLIGGAECDNQSTALLSLGSMETFLFEYLVFVVFVTDTVTGAQLAGSLRGLLQDTQLGSRIKALWQTAQNESS